jgi:hypothetical protein
VRRIRLADLEILVVDPEAIDRRAGEITTRVVDLSGA